jgi:membrane-bound lytic murein transglycosylase B
VFLGLFLLTGQLAAESDSGGFELLQKRLIKDGFDKARIEQLYDNPRVYSDREGASLFFLHKEAQLNYDQFTTHHSIRTAKTYMETHKNALDKAEQRFGVDKKIITAIILVETRLGTLMGRRSVINTLSTLASLEDADARERMWAVIPEGNRPTRNDFENWAQRKSAWAYAELKAFISYTDRDGIEPVEVTGSYAGAFGIAQFMPSSILSYAQDGNSDGIVNLFDHADAIASVAGYLKLNGWQPNMHGKEAYQVIYRYNRSSYYVNVILKISELLKG